MITIALTGGIGSGKTAVTGLFQQFDSDHCLKVIDADVIARELLSGSLENQPSEALSSVHAAFGESVFEKNKEGLTQLNRHKLRELIFASHNSREQLEQLLHPLVYQEIFKQIKQLKKESEHLQIIIVAIPLLFETQAEQLFDRILVIDAPVETQIQRCMARDQNSRELIEQIINTQVDRQTRISKADDIIDNAGTPDELASQVKTLYRHYCEKARKNY
jgi:dephospho-CoA kinase